MDFISDTTHLKPVLNGSVSVIDESIGLNTTHGRLRI